MALRNQPYLPLYVQDFLTDEKLNECSAKAVGVYIKIMCVMHKSDEYGTILLKQKDKQNSSTTKNFAYKLVKHLPFPVEVIDEAITELLVENVLTLDGDKLLQRRMVKDNDISDKRSKAGSEGGKRTQFAKANPKAKGEANSEIENESETDSRDKHIFSLVLSFLNTTAGKKFTETESTKKFINARLEEGFTLENFQYVITNKTREWKGTSNEKYLRPETLFNATKFQSYLNEPSYGIPGKPNQSKSEYEDYETFRKREYTAEERGES